MAIFNQNDYDAMFEYSPFICLGVGFIISQIAQVFISMPQSGSDAYAGAPFAKDWGHGWGRFRNRMSSIIFLTVLAVFSPLMFTDVGQ